MINNKYSVFSCKSFEFPKKKNIPLFGGTIFMIYLLLAGKVNYIILLAYLIGLLDDIIKIRDSRNNKTEKGGLSFSNKLILYSFLSFLVIQKYGFLNGINFFILLNGFNFIDGIDGLAGIVSIILLLNTSFKGLIFPIMVFLIYNFHQAEIFMGDNGSNLIGSLIALSSINQIKLTNLVLYTTFFEGLLVVLLYKIFKIFPNKMYALKPYQIIEKVYNEKIVCLIYFTIAIICFFSNNIIKNIFVKILIILFSTLISYYLILNNLIS